MSRMTDEKLMRLLDGDPKRLEKHFEEHPEDADRVETLTELSSPMLDGLRGAFDAPDDLAARVQARLAGDPVGKETMQITADVFGLAWRTAQVVFGKNNESPRAGEN